MVCGQVGRRPSSVRRVEEGVDDEEPRGVIIGREAAADEVKVAAELHAVEPIILQPGLPAVGKVGNPERDIDGVDAAKASRVD